MQPADDMTLVRPRVSPQRHDVVDRVLHAGFFAQSFCLIEQRDYLVPMLVCQPRRRRAASPYPARVKVGAGLVALEVVRLILLVLIGLGETFPLVRVPGIVALSFVPRALNAVGVDGEPRPNVAVLARLAREVETGTYKSGLRT
ncbi:hypothetical protein GW813_15470 [bacterium]|nr:hypothetical protein [bacterium]